MIGELFVITKTVPVWEEKLKKDFYERVWLGMEPGTFILVLNPIKLRKVPYFGQPWLEKQTEDSVFEKSSSGFFVDGYEFLLLSNGRRYVLTHAPDGELNEAFVTITEYLQE